MPPPTPPADASGYRPFLSDSNESFVNIDIVEPVPVADVNLLIHFAANAAANPPENILIQVAQQQPQQIHEDVPNVEEQVQNVVEQVPNEEQVMNEEEQDPNEEQVVNEEEEEVPNEEDEAVELIMHFAANANLQSNLIIYVAHDEL